MQKIILKTVVCCLCALIYIIPKDSSANSAEEGAVVVIASRTPTIRNLLGGGLNILNKETIVNRRAIFIPEILTAPISGIHNFRATFGKEQPEVIRKA